MSCCTAGSKTLTFALLAMGIAAVVHAGGTPATAAPVADVDGRRIIAADSEPGNWMSHGRTYSEQRFSPLKRITEANVAKLGLAWHHDIYTRTARGLEATPIVVDGVLYTSTAWSHVLALDARTGAKLWEFDPEVDGTYAARACCDVVNRGVAVWKGKVFIGAIDGRLIALDATTGKKVWETLTVDRSKDYTITGAPRVVKGKVIIGNGGAEFGVRGYVSAYDAETGAMAWRFYTVPGNPEDGFESPILEIAAKTWAGEWWKYGGGGTVWDSMSYDPDLDLLYIGVGNGSTWNRKIRSQGTGDNLFLSSIVALRPDTGEYVWHFQTTPGESWDYTATQHMILADLVIEGRPRKVLMQAPKNGFFYVLDRETGAFISGKPYIALTWAKGLDPAGRPIVDPQQRYEDTGKPTLVVPGPLGGHNWHPMSFNPQTGLVYIPTRDAGAVYAPAAPDNYSLRPGAWRFGLDMTALTLPEDAKERIQAAKGVKGRLIAWDPVRQVERWAVEMPMIWNGGVVSTAGNLVFAGNAQGLFVAYRADTGEKLWEFAAGTGIVAAPVTYEVDGEQYVTVLAGWGGAVPIVFPGIVADAPSNGTNRVLTFKLGGSAHLPVAEKASSPLAPPPAIANSSAVETGRILFQENCFRCHGESAVGGPVLPDLRRSAAIGDPALWGQIVLGGALAFNGMAPFATQLSQDEVEKIRSYVIKRAEDEVKNPSSSN